QCPRDTGHRLRSVIKSYDGEVDCLTLPSVANELKDAHRKFRSVLAGCAWTFFFLALLSAAAKHASAQCQGSLTSPEDAAHCTAVSSVPMSKAEIDPNKPYRLEELIDIAETNNPRTRIAWEAAKQAANRLGLARSDYFPHLAALALSGDQRVIEPWPKPLGAPSGYFLI